MDAIDTINKKSYTSKKTCDSFASCSELQLPEKVILDRIKKEVKDGTILDIGVGAGRTINALTQISNDYIGIDYSQTMVNACNKNFPHVKALCCDARDMSIFQDEQFSFVIFSYNGIDYVSHSDRILILKEIFRLLKPNGYFVFSTHNRTFNNRPFIFNLSLHPLVAFKSIKNRFKNRKFEIYTSEYAIINDAGQDYSLLTYYIDIKEQIEQLLNIGFNGAIEVYGLDGKRINDFISSDPWIYYCAKKQ